MAFANSWLLLIGSLSIALPIFLHLLMRPRPKSFQFPAIRFIQQVQKTNQRRMRLRHWILLFLRCLVIFVIFLALARPSTTSAGFGPWITLGGIIASAFVVAWLFIVALFWTRPINRVLVATLAGILVVHLIGGAYFGYRVSQSNTRHLLGDQSAPVAAVFIIDTSPTMTYRFENATRLEEAKKIGKWLIDQLPLNSKVAIVPTDSSNIFFSDDIRAAEKRLETMDVEWSSQPAIDRLNEAIDWVDDSEIERKEIYVLSEMTRRSWSAKTSAIKDKLLEATDTSVYLFDVSVENPVNFSLGPLKLNSSRLSTKSKLEIETELFRQGPGAQRTLQMFLEKPDLSRPYRKDGKTIVPDEYLVRNQSATISADSSSSIKFSLSELPSGVHHGWVQVDGSDPISVDNKRYFTIQVRNNWQVLIATPKDVSPNNVSEAIAPFAFIETGENLYDVKLIDQANLGREDFGEYDAIFLLDPERMNDAAWDDLRSYVNDGGGLVVVPGHNATDNQVIDESFVTESALNVLPAALTRVFRSPAGGVFLNPMLINHPIVEDFQSMGTGIPWNRFPVQRYWGIDPESVSNEADSSVVVAYGDGTPAILERRIGTGSVVLWTTPLTEPVRPQDRVRWNDLMIGNAWPVFYLINQNCEFLVENQAETLNYTIGQTAVLNNDPKTYPTEYRLFTPRGDDPTKVLASDDRLSYSFTNIPGPFRLKGLFDGPVVRGFSVNLPAESTDLTRISTLELDRSLGEDNYQLASEREEIVRQQSSMRIGTEFYPILMLLLAGIFAAEHLMSNRFYQ